MKYEKMVREIVEAIGGKENILNVYHCATRLRFQLKQEDTIQDETVKNIEGVLSVVKGGGQYQIVIGRHVGDVYQELLSVYDMQKEESGLKDAKEFKEEMKDKKISSRFIDTISGVFTPILNLLIATGIIKCFLALMTATGLMDATAGTYQILSIAGDCFFYFMPVFLGYTAMKKFGGTPFVGMAIGGICYIFGDSSDSDELCKLCDSGCISLLFCGKAGTIFGSLYSTVGEGICRTNAYNFGRCCSGTSGIGTDCNIRK